MWEALCPQIAQALPQPVTAAELLSLDVGDADSAATIRFSGDSGEVTIRPAGETRAGVRSLSTPSPIG